MPLELIPALARAADIATRNDAAKGLWVGERDYVAAFLATLRNTWRLLGGEAELRLGNLAPTAETLLGCDFLLVLQGDHFFKYGLFKAQMGAQLQQLGLRQPPVNVGGITLLPTSLNRT